MWRILLWNEWVENFGFSSCVMSRLVPHFWPESSAFGTSEVTNWANRRHISENINPQLHYYGKLNFAEIFNPFFSYFYLGVSFIPAVYVCMYVFFKFIYFSMLHYCGVILHVYVCMYVLCMYVYIICVSMYECMCMYVCMYVFKLMYFSMLHYCGVILNAYVCIYIYICLSYLFQHALLLWSNTTCVCIYVCMYICIMYVCMYVCVYTYVLCMCVCMYVCMCVYMYVLCMYVCVCMYVCIYVCMYLCVYVCVCIMYYIYIYI